MPDDPATDATDSTDQADTKPQVEAPAPKAGTEIATQESVGAMQIAEEQKALAVIQDAINQNVDKSELQISRLAIMQPQSPEITSQEQGFVMGQIVDNVNRDVYTDLANPPWLKGKVPDDQLEPVHSCLIVPIFKLPSEFIKWIKKDEQEPGGDMWEWKSLDQNDPKVREGIWPPIGTFKGDKPPVTTNINMLCMVLNPDDGFARSSFIVATFARTSFSTGKNLVTQCQAHGMSGLPYWGRCYWLYTKQETRIIGTTPSHFYVYKIAKGPALTSVNQAAEPILKEFALWLADPELGRSRQESLINSAELGDGEGKDEVSGDVADDDDPFAKAPGTDGEEGFE